MRANYLVILSALWAGQGLAFSLPDQVIHPYECESCDALSHDNLSSRWPTSQLPLGHDTMHSQKSNKYTLRVTLNDLTKGVALNTLAPGAVIRISPAHPDAALKLTMQLQTPDQHILPLKDASVLFAENEGLQESAFAGESITALQLKPELGYGQFVLKSAPIQGHEQDTYIVHVFDQGSDAYLTVSTDKARYHYGDELVATFSLRDDAVGYPIDVITANLIAPDGTVRVLPLEKVAWDLYQSKIGLRSEKGYHGENWYIEAQVDTDVSGRNIKRQAHTAFSYTIPSAAVRSIKRGKTTEPFQFTANVDVATGSRYALQIVLFATNEKGKVVPIDTVQSAAWFTTGLHELSFGFNPEHSSQYKAPYYLGALQLTDYGQLKAVYEYSQLIPLQQIG